MYTRKVERLFPIALYISIALMLLNGQAALAQGIDLRATDVGSTSITAEWDAVAGVNSYDVHYKSESSTDWTLVTSTTETSQDITGLNPNTAYKIRVWYKGNGVQGYSTRDVTTLQQIRKKKQRSRRSVKPEPEPEPDRHRAPLPPPITCPYLPSRVVVTGYVSSTQCQMVGEAGVGRMDLLQRGFIDAVDIWSYVNGGLEVCFRNTGSLVFLDAAYSPRMALELNAFQRNGMTCGTIDGAGTVVLLRSGAPRTSVAPPPPGGPTLPTFDSIPLSNCFIKLVETLFLRAEPAGEIIGLVWVNSEVSAFEINGYWYKIEFEGKTGYISRYHRKVLRGGCG